MTELTFARRIERLERDMAALRSRNNGWKAVALGVFLVAGLALARTGETGKKKVGVSDGVTTLTLDAEGIVYSRGGEELSRFSPSGFTFQAAGKKRLSGEVSEFWTGMTVHGPDGTPALAAGTDEESGTSIKIFSTANRQLRLEMADRLLDAGSGVRVYDANGKPRATLYTERRGETGLELTDANRQPRIDIYAQAGGVSVLRAMDSTASSVVEMTVISETDARVRATGVLPTEIPAQEQFVPMLYLLDRSGKNQIEMPVRLD